MYFSRPDPDGIDAPASSPASGSGSHPTLGNTGVRSVYISLYILCCLILFESWSTYLDLQLRLGFSGIVILSWALYTNGAQILDIKGDQGYSAWRNLEEESALSFASHTGKVRMKSDNRVEVVAS